MDTPAPRRAGRARPTTARNAVAAALALAVALAAALLVAPPFSRQADAAERAARSDAAPLTDAEVRGFIERIADAARSRDVARLGATLADDGRIELRSRIGGVERTTTFTKAEYVAMLDHGYASMRELEAYDYRIVDLKVTLDPGGRTATAHSTIRETVVIGGRSAATLSDEVTRIERRDGRLVVVAVSATTAAE